LDVLIPQINFYMFGLRPIKQSPLLRLRVFSTMKFKKLQSVALNWMCV